MASNKTAPVYETLRVKLSQVADNPNNARNKPTDEKGIEAWDKGIKDLSDDIKANGNLAPMVVIRTSDPDQPYQVQEGSRRYAAFTLLEWEEVDIRVIPFKDAVDHELIGLAGNMDREELTTYDIAKRLSEIKAAHPTLGDNVIATRVGRSKSHVQNLIRVYDGLHPKIIKAWSNNHGMATSDNLLKIVKEDKDDQWKMWQTLCGVDPETGEGEGDTEGGPEVDAAPKRNAKRAAQKVLAAIVAHKGMKPEQKELAVQSLQYVLNLRKSPPKGISLEDAKEE